MARIDDKLNRAKPVATDLESYRRLIELQKQMIELSQHHERSRRDCELLRAKVAREVAEHMRARKSMRHRMQLKVVKFLKRWRLGPLTNLTRLMSRVRTTPSASN